MNSSTASRVRRQSVQGDQSGWVEVLRVMNGVSYVIRPIHDLCFKTLEYIICLISGPGKLEIISFSRVGRPTCGAFGGFEAWLLNLRILESSVKGCPRQIEPWMLVSPDGQLGDDPKGLCVPFVPVDLAGVEDEFVQRRLRDVPERWVSEIVRPSCPPRPRWGQFR